VIEYCPRCGGNSLEWRVPRRDDKERQTCDACGYVHYEGPVLAAGAILHDGDQLCLVRRSHEPGLGKWCFPGGFVDIDEHPEAAALRETAEEAGASGEIERLLGVYGSRGPRDKRVAIVVYVARMTGAVEPSGSEEVAEVKWFAPADIPWDELAFDSTGSALREYLAT
jgi:ADP-ribose pyrophosphatase YjhB (NUDIX family)